MGIKRVVEVMEIILFFLVNCMIEILKDVNAWNYRI